MRTSYPIVPWHKIIWFSQCIPRHTFIMWLALHQKLQTQDIIAKWNTGSVLKCALCGQGGDSVPHLFFQCKYSSKVWTTLKGMFHMDQVGDDWNGIVGCLMSMHQKNNIKSVPSKIGTATCVYNVWHERNLRLFQDEHKDEETLIKIVKNEIKWKLMSLNVKKSAAVMLTYLKWNIDVTSLG